MDSTLLIRVAQVCHEANRAWCAAHGDLSQQSWLEAEEWQRASALAGVRHALSGEMDGYAMHRAWVADKLADGWTYGKVKDPERKKHPSLVRYDQLPETERAKDVLFLAIVRALAVGGDDDR